MGPSGIPVPTSNLTGWNLIFTDDFTTNVSQGSFPGTVYGPKWFDLDGWSDGEGGTFTSANISVSNSCMTINLRTVGGVIQVSDPYPIIPGAGTEDGVPTGQLYGRYDVCFKADAGLGPGFKTAFMLWTDEQVWAAGEIDWPDSNIVSTFNAGDHTLGNPGSLTGYFETSAVYTTWHVATIEWTPSNVTFLLDGAVVGQSMNVPTVPMHYVLQTQCSTDGTAPPASSVNGNVYVDWVAVYSYAGPATPVSPFVQSMTAGNQSTSPSTATLTFPVTAGNQLVLVHLIEGASGQTITGVTGGEASGHYWAKLIATSAGGYYYQDVEIWWLDKAAAGAVTASVAYTGGNYGSGAGLWLAEFKNITAVDGTPVVVTGTSGTATVTTNTPALANELALAVLVSGLNPPVWSPTPAGWDTEQSVGLLGYEYPMVIGYQVIPGSSPVTLSQALNGSVEWVAISALFKTATAATAAESVSVTSTAAGVVKVPGAGTGSVAVTGTAAGAHSGLNAGAAAGSVSVTGTAAGYWTIILPPDYHPPPNVWADAILADGLQIVTVGEVYAGINGPLLATINNITNGTVKIDQTNANRRTCSDIFMAIDASTTYLVPGVNSGDLFPDGGELFLQKGLVYPDGTTQLQPLGRFLIETPKVTRAVNGAGSLVIDLSGTDRSGTVARSLFTQPYATDGVSTVDVAIMAILNMQVPQLTAFAFAASPLVPPVASYAVGDNAWTACQALAALDSKELFFDPSVNAVCILRDIPDA
ncbi:MAG: DUF5047 domain-containing protein, partial [Solirubrobacteraceae bacterium]